MGGPSGTAPWHYADTHCHLDMKRFDSDRDLVLDRAREAGVDRCLVPALNVASTRRAIALADVYPGLFAAIGIHPTEAHSSIESDIEEFERMASHPRVVAIGEIGLDYYWVTDAAERSLQREVLCQQLGLASRLKKPVVLHMREAGDAESGACADDLLRILENWLSERRSIDPQAAQPAGVLHSFSGSLEAAQRAIELGFYIGVTGPITYAKAERRRQKTASLPLERLLIETDAPFLAPEPHRGQRNEPAFVVHIADRIAEIQSRTPREVAEATSANAERLFAWGELI